MRFFPYIPIWIPDQLTRIWEGEQYPMFETIKHLLGFCGEPHGFVYYLLFGGTFVSGITTYIKSIIKGDNFEQTTIKRIKK